MKSSRSSAAPAGESAMPFMSQVGELRRRAREHIEQGAVTPSYMADKQVVLNLLNDALAAELVCVLRYRRHYFMADGLLAEAVKKEFLAHSIEEQAHADQIAERIAIESYQEMIAYLDGRDHTTRRMFEGILAVEAEHAEKLASMLMNVHRLAPATAGAQPPAEV